MRIFVYEYLSSGMSEETETLSSLNAEGGAMLRSLLSDFGSCDGVATTTMLDPRSRDEPKRWPTNVEVHFPFRELRERTFDSLAAGADYTLVIAPEFDDILARLAKRVEEVGGRLLGPSLGAIQCSTDKAFLTSLWEKAGVPIPKASFLYPLVYKPRFGAGSQATFLIHNHDELGRAERRRIEEKWSGEMFRQPFVRGLSASVSFLAGPAGWHALPAVEQRLSCDGRFHYLGGRLPLPPHLDARARRLAERAARIVEGWLGWFGVDLVLGDAEDGSGDVAIEINPRMTTSYLGLRLLARFNLAKAMLGIVAGSPPSSWEWNRDTVVFDVGDRERVD